MIRKITYLIALIASTIVVYLIDSTYPEFHLWNVFLTLLALLIVYFVLIILVGEGISGRIKDAKAKYSFRKTITILAIASAALILAVIWIEDSTALVVSYGIIGAGVAISLQDVFKNFAGGLIILTSGIYRVGDRVEIQNMMGDVIDIGIMYTTLLEIRQWVNGDQATGRLVSLPNGLVITGSTYNFTRDHRYLWDEIMIPLTYDSDWKQAKEAFLKILRSQTDVYQEGAQRDIDRIGEKYYLPSQDIEPNIYIVPTDNWIALHLRYVVPVRERRLVRDRISREIIEFIEKVAEIKVASESINISDFPILRYGKDEGTL
ncbi:MAG TPA: mechanosensitive ion channel domain-containing protein [Methanomassiliicoccales archaeon]|nr:mechanosensitive ion channel domain-containing protein [Methanomassiliicoccales archaeon]